MGTLKNRLELADLCNSKGIRRVVEVGVDRGVFALEFVIRWKGDIFVGVDPWQPYPQMPYDRTPDMLMAIHNLAPYAYRVKLIRASSPEAVGMLGPYHSPGFIYIDASHDYEDVKRDIEGWYPALPSGGILAGHDYTEEADGVRRAVNEFARSRGLELSFTEDRDEAISWWVTKP